MPADSQTGSVIAVDLGRSKVLAAVVDSEFTISARQQHDVSGLSDFTDLLAVAVDVAAELATAHPASAVGLSLAADVDVQRGIVYYRKPAAGDRAHVGRGPREELELVKEVTARCGLPAGLENDGIAALRAEWRAGVAQGLSDVCSLILGTHIGAAVVSGGQIVRRSTSGPLLGGVVSFTGETGEKGETVIAGDRCSGTGIAKAYGAPNAAAVIARARQGDERALAVLDEAGTWLGILLASTINVYAPQAIVLGGGVMAAQDLLLPAARRILARETTLPPVSGDTEILLARYGAEAGLIGAAVCAFESA